MRKFVYAPIFVRQFKKLGENLKEEVWEKIEMFRDVSNHKTLRVHKLSGPFEGRYSFSVNYNFRIVFSYSNKKKEVNLLAIGDHDVYKN
ncbi:MAG: type II toxin-antitoxin system mRNA interferase toxin, RelE/StbE family [Candidatus Paceibacterota bacterium]|jgi:mRNA-degrading endonuclease YafQ of YafQ-DinJ toxin-antitoxin module